MSPNFPRGIEVLLKKASLDPEFCERLLNDPQRAAEFIGLELEPMERTMLSGMPREQLAVIISRTTVPQPQRRAFLGTTAAAMLAVLTGTQSSMAGAPPEKYRSRSGGAQPDLPAHASMGIRPDEIDRILPFLPRLITEELRPMVAKMLQIDEQKIDKKTQLGLASRDLTIISRFRQEIYDKFDVRMPFRILRSFKTFHLLLKYISDSRTEYRDDTDEYGTIPGEKQENEVSW